jgi:hypothetical protein
LGNLFPHPRRWEKQSVPVVPSPVALLGNTPSQACSTLRRLPAKPSRCLPSVHRRHTPTHSMAWVSHGFPHTPAPFHSHFQRLCGRGGKSGAPLTLRRQVFKSSSIPQPGFRKPTPTSTSCTSWTSSEYPLFLPELRLLLSFISLILIFSSYPSRWFMSFPRLADAPIPLLALPSEACRTKKYRSVGLL